MPIPNVCQTVVNDVDLTALASFLSPELDETCVNTSEKSLYLPEEFNNHVDHLSLNESTNIFSCIHMNCRSIGKNIDSVTSLLSALNIQFSAIGVSETWLRPGDSMCNIDSYDFIGNGRERRRGGGVGIFIRKDLDFIHRSELDINTEFIESLFVEIKSSHKNTIFSAIYRPPGCSVQYFLESLNQVLQTVNTENKDVFFTGEFNIDLMNVFDCTQVKDFLDIFMVNSMYPISHFPTRITNNTSEMDSFK